MLELEAILGRIQQIVEVKSYLKQYFIRSTLMYAE